MGTSKQSTLDAVLVEGGRREEKWIPEVDPRRPVQNAGFGTPQPTIPLEAYWRHGTSNKNFASGFGLALGRSSLNSPMPEISVGSQVFDVVFHPNRPTVYTGLLTGHIKSFSYNAQGSPSQVFSLRPSKRSCRGLSLNEDGSKLYAVGKAKALNIIDTATQSIDTRSGAHDAPINRVKSLMPWMVATGDDDGTVKLWDPRQREVAKTYTQHFDYISDFLWLPDKKQLVSTSGDGTLSVMDIRSKKPEPIAHSEDQEDELLSVVAIKGSTKILVGTQIGVISVFNRNKGWGDCVDRIPGHPLSVDALCNVPAGIDGVDYESTVLTGSSDGYVRAVQILPTKLLGVVADHGEFPVERIAVGEGAEGNSDEDSKEETSHDTKVKRSADADEDAENEDDLSREKKWWVGSVGHDDVLRLTDLEGFFRESAKEDQELEADDDDDEDSDLDDGGLDAEAENQGPPTIVDVQKGDDDEWSDEEDDEENPTPPVVAKDTRKREVEEEESQDEEDDGDGDGKAKNKNKKRKLAEKDSIRKSKKGKKESQVIDKGFFDGL
ncbi:hypothetical protein NMY22_g16498 [Coprinellus aureogranulatus]|nr:hypothetical protein NMY22_g16498 [Coprinellus aureogranulatus]